MNAECRTSRGSRRGCLDFNHCIIDAAAVVASFYLMNCIFQTGCPEKHIKEWTEGGLSETLHISYGSAAKRFAWSFLFGISVRHNVSLSGSVEPVDLSPGTTSMMLSFGNLRQTKRSSSV